MDASDFAIRLTATGPRGQWEWTALAGPPGATVDLRQLAAMLREIAGHLEVAPRALQGVANAPPREEACGPEYSDDQPYPLACPCINCPTWNDVRRPACRCCGIAPWR